MSYADELAGLKLRLVTDPDRRDTVKRRIGEVESAMAVEPQEPQEPVETAVEPRRVETAMKPPAKGRKPKG